MAQAAGIGSDLKNAEQATLKEHPSARYKANVENGVRQKTLDS